MNLRKTATLVMTMLIMNGALGEEPAPAPTQPVQPPQQDKMEKADRAVKTFLKGFDTCQKYSDAVRDEANDEIRQYVQLAGVLWMVSGLSNSRHKDMDNEVYFQLSLVEHCLHNPEMRFGEATSTLLVGNTDWVSILHSAAPLLKGKKTNDDH